MSSLGLWSWRFLMCTWSLAKPAMGLFPMITPLPSCPSAITLLMIWDREPKDLARTVRNWSNRQRLPAAVLFHCKGRCVGVDMHDV